MYKNVNLNQTHRMLK